MFDFLFYYCFVLMFLSVWCCEIGGCGCERMDGKSTVERVVTFVTPTSLCLGHHFRLSRHLCVVIEDGGFILDGRFYSEIESDHS